MIVAEQFQRLNHSARLLFPGIAVSLLVAVAARFLSEHYATPAMLMALLLGMAVSFLAEEGKTAEGVHFASKALLRIGVAFLGARISIALLQDLGGPVVALIVAGLVCTVFFGLAVGSVFGAKWRFSFLTSGSVAICGASAAMAIAAILPRDERSEERLIFTVVGVTLLSTIAMIAYPILTDALALTEQQAGIFLGGTIHDVAQVVGAGFSVSDTAGDTATLVKLIRVAMLAPVILIASVLIRRSADAKPGSARPPILPAFVLAFLVFAGLNSVGALPGVVTTVLGESSRWFLLIAIAAVGMKTNLKQVLGVGPAAIGLILAETAFIALFILLGLQLIT